MRHYLGGNNNHRATWVTDTIPRVMAAGQSYPVSVTVRNDGWDTWSEASQYRLSHAFLPAGDAADKSLVVDNDGVHGVQERSGSVRLLAGKHPIEITYLREGRRPGARGALRGTGHDEATHPRMPSCSAGAPRPPPASITRITRAPGTTCRTSIR